MDRAPSVLALPDDVDTVARVRDLVEARPVALLDIAADIASGKGALPVDAVARGARAAVERIRDADPVQVRTALERALLGRDVDLALEWLQRAGVLAVLFPELEATVDLQQESDRLHKDVWAHTKQVVKQSVRRPQVRWAALFHDIGKVPTRTFTDKGVHFHGHAEVGARMFDKIAARMPFERDMRRAVRFLVKHHLRSNQYSGAWTDSAVRRFHREMQAHLTDLLDLSRADITSKRPGRRKQLLEQIAALSDRIDHLAIEDAKLPPLPGGVGNAIMDAFELRPSRQIGDLKKHLEDAIARGELEPRREDAYYVLHLARSGLVHGVPPERLAAIADAATAQVGATADPGREDDGHDGDPDRPRPGVLDCAGGPDCGHDH